MIFFNMGFNPCRIFKWDILFCCSFFCRGEEYIRDQGLIMNHAGLTGDGCVFQIN